MEPLRREIRRTLARPGSAVAYSLAFKVVNLILLTPLAVAVGRLFLQRTGKASVGNFEIAAFFLSPLGLLALAAVGAILLASLYLELAGLMRILADHRLAWWRALTGTAGSSHRLLSLGLRQFATYCCWPCRSRSSSGSRSASSGPGAIRTV